MRYLTEIFRHDGIFLGATIEDAPSKQAAIARSGVPHFYDRRPGEKYCHVQRYVEPDYSNPTCSRCGGPRALCGGPTNPHE